MTKPSVKRLLPPSAQDHADDDAQGVLRGDSGGDADGHDAQPQGVGEDGVEPGADAVFEEHTQGAANEDEHSVDDSREHGDGPFFLLSTNCCYHITDQVPL